MKTESNIRPEAVAVEICANGIAEVVLRENIVETEREEETIYTYDEYRTPVPYRDNLLETVKKTAAEWLAAAKNAEYAELASSVRAKREDELTKCDWTQAADSPLTSEQKAAWAVYRQALRDIPEQTGFPYDVQYPEKPGEE